jgi:hypothetical protein
VSHRYGQLSTDLFFKADEEGLGREFAFVVAWMAQAGQESLPFKEFQKAVRKLSEIGIVLKLDDVLGAALANRVRQQRHRNKIKDIATNGNVTPNVTPNVTNDVTSNVSSLSHSLNISSPTEKRERAPRAPRTAKLSLDAWSPNEEHKAIARERGVSLEHEVAKMRDFVKSSGKTYKDYDAFARNWLRRARPEPVGRPTLVRPNLSNNLLQTDHPDNAGEEYWLQGIDKYKYGGTNG